MKQLTINIEEEKLDFFKQLIDNFDFLEIRDIKDLDEKMEFVDELKSSLKEVELHEQGKIKLQTLDEFLDEV